MTMADLSARFRAADEIPVDGMLGTVHERIREVEGGMVVVSVPRPSSARPRIGAARRLATVAATFLVASLVVGLALRVFSLTTLVAAPVLETPPAGWRPPAGLGPDGALYVTDCLHARVYRFDLDGSVTPFAGAGLGGFTNGFSGDGGPATAAHFGCPTGIGWDAIGRLFVVDHLNDRIRMIDRTGIITTIAGDLGSDLGDGGPALDAALDQPTYLAFSPSGDLYFSDRDAARIRKIDAGGTITTVAGTGEAGYSGDGGPATQAQIDMPNGLVIDDSGNLYFSDAGNNRVRKVDTNGVITTVAGDGHPRYAGDDGPAIDSSLSDPSGLALDEAGNLYIADYDNAVIRRVSPDGVITTVAGTGDTRGPLEYDGPARSGHLDAPETLTYRSDGTLFITEDAETPRILTLDLRTGTLTTLAERCPTGALSIIGRQC
jgi:sugar lactone lactonase YvrE